MREGRGKAATPWAWLRPAIGALLAAAGSLALIPAPSYLLWQVSVGVTEWGVWFALLALTPLLPGWRQSWAGRLGALLGVVGAALALSSLIRAAPVATQLPAALARAFGDPPSLSSTAATPRPAPLVALDVVRGIGSPPVRLSTFAYTSADSQTLQMDLYQPANPPPAAPVVVMIHGGSWQSGARSELPALNSYLAARGYVVAAIDYRLAPRWRFPAAFDDVHAALDYLKTHAPDLGVDPTRIALIGRSAGGELALSAGYTPPDATIRGVVSLYGPTDLVWAYDHPGNPAVLDGRAVLTAYLGGTPATAGAFYGAASPINYVGPDTPPTLLIHGDQDELVAPAQSARLAARLAAAGRPYLYLRLPWATHGCDANLAGPCGQITTYAIERFLAAVFAR